MGRVALGKDVRTATREEPNGSVLSPMLEGSPDAPPALHATPLPPGEEPTAASLRDVLRNRHFRSLWIAQICSQLAQNLTWITLGAFVRQQTKQTTLVAVIIVSAMLAQLFLSGFAGVLVDRASKRAVLFNSNVLRVILTLLFIAATPLTVAVQTTTIIILIFIANAVAQFFMPAEAATIPLVVEKRNLIAATSLFNITVNACQVIPVTLGLLVFTLIGIVPVLLSVAGLYVVAAVLGFTLPPPTAGPRLDPVATGGCRPGGGSPGDGAGDRALPQRGGHPRRPAGHGRGRRRAGRGGGDRAHDQPRRGRRPALHRASYPYPAARPAQPRPDSSGHGDLARDRTGDRDVDHPRADACPRAHVSGPTRTCALDAAAHWRRHPDHPAAHHCPAGRSLRRHHGDDGRGPRDPAGRRAERLPGSQPPGI